MFPTGYEIMQTARPEAMCRVTGNNEIGELEGTDSFSALGSVRDWDRQTHSHKPFNNYLKNLRPGWSWMQMPSMYWKNNEALLKRMH